MKLLIRLALVFLLVASSPECIPLSPAQTQAPSAAGDSTLKLRTDLDKVFADSRLAQAQTVVEVFSLDRSEILYEKNPQQLFIPASTNKIIPAAVALLRLGAEFRFETRVLTDGPIENGTLKGNLIVVGSGDPSCSPRFHEGDPFAAFKNWATRLKEKSIRAISGSILGDDSAFADPGLGMGWEWNDLPYAYATGVGALQFNDNMIALEITPGAKKGNPGLINASPLGDYLDIANQTITGPKDAIAEIEAERLDSNEKVRVYGTVPEKGGSILQTMAVQHPTRFYLSALERVLSREGISTNRWGITRSGAYDPPDYSLLWSQQSPPLPEIVKPLLKNSQNLYAETLVRALGLTLRGEGNFAKGKEVVEETLDQMGIHTGTYSFADGSGLSRLNLESADSFVRLLRYMQQDRNFQLFYDALPVAGVDGTLSARMKKTKAENNVRAKTGTMTNVSAIAGYLKTADGELLAFCIAVNNLLAPRELAESIQDKALEKLTNFRRK